MGHFQLLVKYMFKYFTMLLKNILQIKNFKDLKEFLSKIERNINKMSHLVNAIYK